MGDHPHVDLAGLDGTHLVAVDGSQRSPALQPEISGSPPYMVPNVSQISGEEVQTLDPGGFDLLARMSATIGDSLMPLVQSLGRHVKTSEAAGDRRLTDLGDRTLKNLDQMKDLVAALRKIDTRGIRTPAASQGG